MIEQLLLSKRLFLAGKEYAGKDDPISTGMAISLFQDSVEIFIWSVLKEYDAQPGDRTPFVQYFDLVEKAPKNLNKKGLPFKAKMLDLNKARVNFKHYGILPDSSEAEKYSAYTEVFLEEAFSLFFNEDFNTISLTSLIPFQDVRDHISNAEAELQKDNLKQTYLEISAAKYLLFQKVGNFLPEVGCSLRDADEILGAVADGHVHVFSELQEYFTNMLNIIIASLCGISLKEYYSMEQNLFVVDADTAGGLHFRNLTVGEYDSDFVVQAINCLTKMSIQLGTIVR